MIYNFKVVIFADGDVGESTVRYVHSEFPEDLAAIVVSGVESKIFYQNEFGFGEDKVLIHNQKEPDKIYTKLSIFNHQLNILAWWPYIIREPIISSSKFGTINFHPSLLPYNRGKNYNFWNLVEDVPFGVSIHFVEERIDTGDILFQKEIEKNWEDTGGTLYFKAKKEVVSLFVENYLVIRKGELLRRRQDLGKGSFHYARELESASEISLDRFYSGRELLNLLRARTFPPHPGCHFSDGEEKYEVNIKIKKIK